MKVHTIITRLEALANEEVILQKEKKFGVKAINTLGIYMKDLNVLVKEIGKDSDLATELFDLEIYEAKILAAKLMKPKDVSPELMEKWIRSFHNWEICDSCCSLFAKGKYAKEKIVEWVEREEEFQKRAGFAMLAYHALADKNSTNEVFLPFFDLIKGAVTDERLYVKKAVNWALRQVGKRNLELRKEAIDICEELLQLSSKSAQWIAKDALRELKSEKTKCMNYPRSVYGPR
ncbi:MAG: DNA alkylation repair protein [Cytophagales bacterium]|nr:DNA alkylation repair protein [Cytophagales bacterium]